MPFNTQLMPFKLKTLKCIFGHGSAPLLSEKLIVVKNETKLVKKKCIKWLLMSSLNVKSCRAVNAVQLS